MRKLIAAMKMSIEGRIEGSEGYADWVASWADEYDLTEQIDACVLGGRMYPNYEAYWTAVRDDADKPASLGAGTATDAEKAWARFATTTPHYVVSHTLSTARWNSTRFLRGLDEVAALKDAPGKDLYLMGGANITAACLDAGLIDELRLIVYPLVAGEGMPLFTDTRRHALLLQDVRTLSDGRVGLNYAVR